jgi:hypothetical protein
MDSGMSNCKAAVILNVYLMLISVNAFSKDYPAGSIVYFKAVTACEDVEFARKFLENISMAKVQRNGPAQYKTEKSGLRGPTWMTTAFQKSSSWSKTLFGVDREGVKAYFCIIGIPNGYLWIGPVFSEEATIVMPEEKFGYHKLYTGEDIYTFRNGKTYEILDTETGTITR